MLQLKWTSVLLFFVCLLAQTCKSASLGAAEDHDWVALDSSDLITVESTKVEALARLEMVHRAKLSIDILTYDQRSDSKIGKPLLMALRAAANRGVKVRFLSSHFAMALREGSRKIQRIMTEPPTATPVEFYFFGGPWMLFKGWKMLDGVHEKIFVVDHKWALITGRGHGEEYLNWVDTGFLFRGESVHRFEALFQRLWESLQREHFFSASPSKGGASQPEPTLEESIDLHLSGAELALVDRVKSWLGEAQERSLDRARDLSGLKLRILHFDFLDQMSEYARNKGTRPLRVSFEEREEVLHDPIVDEVEKILKDPVTRELKFYSLSVTLSRRLKRLLIDALTRGIRIEIITNGQDTYRLVEPFSASFGWFASLEEIDDLLKAGARIHAYKVDSSGNGGFVHRKLLISGDTVLLGSHNLNRSSSTYVDEMMVEVKGIDFANEMRRMFRFDAMRNTEELSYEEIHAFHLQSSLNEWLALFTRVLF